MAFAATQKSPLLYGESVNTGGQPQWTEASRIAPTQSYHLAVSKPAKNIWRLNTLGRGNPGYAGFQLPALSLLILAGQVYMLYYFATNRARFADGWCTGHRDNTTSAPTPTPGIWPLSTSMPPTPTENHEGGCSMVFASVFVATCLLYVWHFFSTPLHPISRVIWHRGRPEFVDEYNRTVARGVPEIKRFIRSTHKVTNAQYFPLLGLLVTDTYDRETHRNEQLYQVRSSLDLGSDLATTNGKSFVFVRPIHEVYCYDRQTLQAYETSKANFVQANTLDVRSEFEETISIAPGFRTFRYWCAKRNCWLPFFILAWLLGWAGLFVILVQHVSVHVSRPVIRKLIRD